MRSTLMSGALLVAIAAPLASCGGGGGGADASVEGLVQILTPAALPAAQTGVAYALDFEAEFPNPPGSFYLSGGALPTGLALDPATGHVEGYPRVVGRFVFELAARDGTDGKLPPGRDVSFSEGRRTYTIDVGRGAVRILPQSLPQAQYRASYGYQIDFAGGTAPFLFVQTGGELPPGLVVSSSGLLGTFPTKAEQHPYTFEVTVTDSAGGSDTATLDVDVVVRPLIIETATLPDAAEGYPYDFALTLASPGGGSPYTWSQVAPGPGESLLSAINMRVSQDGRLQQNLPPGPTNPGLYAFTLQVIDEAGQLATRAYALRVRTSPILTSISPRYAAKPGPFTATGLKFQSGAQLVFGPGTPTAVVVTPTFVNSTTLTFPAVPSLGRSGPVTVRVVNPDGGFDDLDGAVLFPASNIAFGTKGLITDSVSSMGLDCADVSRDGLADIIHCGSAGFTAFSGYSLTSTAGGLHYLQNTGGLTFSTNVLDSSNYTDCKFCDVDVDGDLDIVALATNAIRVWRNDGNGNFTSGPTSSIPSWPSGISFGSEMTIGFFNTDGVPDVAWATGGYVSYAAAYLAVGDGSGGFSLVSSSTSGMGSAFYGVNTIAGVKIDGNSTWDVVAGPSYYGSQTPHLRWTLTQSNGAFSGWNTSGQYTNYYGGVACIRAGNFLGNSPPCVVVATTQDPPDSSGGVGGNQLVVYYGSNLAYSTTLSIPLGMAKSIGVDDWDFDGVDDFAISHKIGAPGTYSPPQSGTCDRVLVYRGATGAQVTTLSLQPGTPTVTLAQSGRVASGDLNGDGRSDLLITTSFWATDNQRSTAWQRADSGDGSTLGIVYFLNASQ